MKRIKELFPNIETEDFKVLSITSDSRYASKDCIFFCIDGLNVDGHKYIDDAIFSGAKCIVYSKPLTYKTPGVLYIKVENVLDELNRVADIFYDFPSKKMTVIGVAGTSGKTIVSHIIKNILNKYLKMGYIGADTIEYDDIYTGTKSAVLDTIDIQRTMNAMVKRDCKGVVVELSSINLALKRANSIHFDYAVFTKVLQEHLDFHATYENVMKSECKLLDLLDENGTAVFNGDDVKFMHYAGMNEKHKNIVYGVNHSSNLKALNVNYYIDHTEFDIQYNEHFEHVYSPYIGEDNVSNVLAAITTLLTLDLPLKDILSSISELSQIEGRMEIVSTHTPFKCIVDYCPYASNYHSLLKFLGDTIKGRLVVVAATPTKKEYGKRKILGELLNEYADFVVLTALDYIDENVLKMCEDIQEYLEDIPSVIVTDRKIAIEQAINNLNDDDVLLVLGKGNNKFFNTQSGILPYPGDSYIIKQTVQHLYE